MFHIHVPEAGDCFLLLSLLSHSGQMISFLSCVLYLVWHLFPRSSKVGECWNCVVLRPSVPGLQQLPFFPLSEEGSRSKTSPVHILQRCWGRNWRCWFTPKMDAKCWSNSAGQGASLEKWNRRRFGSNPFFTLRVGEGETRCSDRPFLQRCRLACWVTPAFCVPPCKVNCPHSHSVSTFYISLAISL